MEKYKPTKLEVLYEVGKEVRQSLKEAGKFLVETVTIIQVLPYILGSIASEEVRNELTEPASPSEKCSISENIGRSVGTITGLGGICAQAFGYGYAVKNDHPEALALPILSNLYFAFRGLSENAKQRLAERNRNSSNGIESRITPNS